MQLRPTTIPKWNITNNNDSRPVPLRQDGISCPLGTVIVKRTTPNDLIQDQRLKAMGFKDSISLSSKSKNIDLTGFHVLIWLVHLSHREI